MKAELAKFFDSGKGTRQHVVADVIKELEKMLGVLGQSSNSVRFYGSSVLVIYCAEAADKGTSV